MTEKILFFISRFEISIDTRDLIVRPASQTAQTCVTTQKGREDL